MRFLTVAERELRTAAKRKGTHRARWITAALFLGLLLWLLALLRALQTETGDHLTGNLSWLPYVISLAVGAVVALLAVRAIGSHKRRARRKGTVA